MLVTSASIKIFSDRLMNFVTLLFQCRVLIYMTLICHQFCHQHCTVSNIDAAKNEFLYFFEIPFFRFFGCLNFFFIIVFELFFVKFYFLIFFGIMFETNH